jgi:hypothetical protein
MIKDLPENVRRSVRRFSQHLKAPGSPVRHLRRIAYKALHPAEVRRRSQAGRQFSSELSPELAATYGELERNGFVRFDAHADPALLAELQAYYRETLIPRREAVQGLKTHPFVFRLATPEDLTTDNILVRFALQDAAVKVAAAYLKTAPYLQSVNLWESRGIQQKKWEASQLWHLDYHDSRALFFWVYLTGVDDVGKGPFTYLPATSSRRVKNNFFPRRIRDEEVSESSLAADVRQVFAPALTCFLVDSTRCYHMGSRMSEGELRCVYIAQFVDPIVGQNHIRTTAPLPPAKDLLIRR